MTKLALIFLTILILPYLASGLIVTLSTPQATFRSEMGSTVNYYVGVENKNNFPVNITIIPPENLQITFNEPLAFSLKAGEIKNRDYFILISKGGSYSENIGVLFEGDGMSFAVQSQLRLIIIGQSEDSSNNLDNSVPNTGSNAQSSSGGGGGGGGSPAVIKNDTLVANATESMISKSSSEAQEEGINKTSLENFNKASINGKNILLLICGIAILAGVFILKKVKGGTKK